MFLKVQLLLSILFCVGAFGFSNAQFFGHPLERRQIAPGGRRPASVSVAKENSNSRNVGFGNIFDLNSGTSNTRTVSKTHGGVRNGGTTNVVNSNAQTQGLNLGGLGISNTVTKTRTNDNGHISRGVSDEFNIGGLDIGTSFSKDNLKNIGLHKNNDGSVGFGLGLLDIDIGHKANPTTSNNDAASSAAATGQRAKTNANARTNTQHVGLFDVNSSHTDSKAVGISRKGPSSASVSGQSNSQGHAQPSLFPFLGRKKRDLRIQQYTEYVERHLFFSSRTNKLNRFLQEGNEKSIEIVNQALMSKESMNTIDKCNITVQENPIINNKSSKIIAFPSGTALPWLPPAQGPLRPMPLPLQSQQHPLLIQQPYFYPPLFPLQINTNLISYNQYYYFRIIEPLRVVQPLPPPTLILPFTSNPFSNIPHPVLEHKLPLPLRQASPVFVPEIPPPIPKFTHHIKKLPIISKLKSRVLKRTSYLPDKFCCLPERSERLINPIDPNLNLNPYAFGGFNFLPNLDGVLNNGIGVGNILNNGILGNGLNGLVGNGLLGNTLPLGNGILGNGFNNFLPPFNGYFGNGLINNGIPGLSNSNFPLLNNYTNAQTSFLNIGNNYSSYSSTATREYIIQEINSRDKNPSVIKKPFQPLFISKLNSSDIEIMKSIFNSNKTREEQNVIIEPPQSRTFNLIFDLFTTTTTPKPILIPVPVPYPRPVPVPQHPIFISPHRPPSYYPCSQCKLYPCQQHRCPPRLPPPINNPMVPCSQCRYSPTLPYPGSNSITPYGGNPYLYGNIPSYGNPFIPSYGNGLQGYPNLFGMSPGMVNTSGIPQSATSSFGSIGSISAGSSSATTGSIFSAILAILG